MTSDHFLCMTCLKSCKSNTQADKWPPIRYSDCCHAPCGLDAEGQQHMHRLLSTCQRDLRALQERSARELAEARAEIARRGELIADQESQLESANALIHEYHTGRR